MIIDAHQHFWQLSRGDYDWLTPELSELYRDFMPTDFAQQLDQNKVGGTILVQAAPTFAETEFLLDIADNTPFVLGVVGWVDFESAMAPVQIAQLAKHPKLVGLRPMIQDIPDDDWMLRPNITPAFEAMIAADLTFDALVLPKHLSNLRKLLRRHPSLRTVIDHGAKPNIANKAFEVWASDIAIIAQESTAYCKLSGLLTEAGTNWAQSDVAPYVVHLLDCFGPERLVWGSDWPVVTLAASFKTWLDMATELIPNGRGTEAVFGSNAADLYKLAKS